CRARPRTVQGPLAIALEPVTSPAERRSLKTRDVRARDLNRSPYLGSSGPLGPERLAVPTPRSNFFRQGDRSRQGGQAGPTRGAGSRGRARHTPWSRLPLEAPRRKCSVSCRPAAAPGAPFNLRGQQLVTCPLSASNHPLFAASVRIAPQSCCAARTGRT